MKRTAKPALLVASLATGLILPASPAGVLVAPARATGPLSTAPGHEEQPHPQVTVVEGGESRTKPEDCRGIIVGPGVNQPDPFPGYGGFVGWESPVRLQNGDWLVGFNAGYWHASAPTPLNYSPRTLAEYRRLGMPADVLAPTGGRAMVTRSSDGGKT